ncbi:hypothetical protein OsJ_18996 [Oryza sativa Japonica Group]|uniref:Uncharacterized protein n=1 Tax=Oryza sativa subsp. japonica TaxID=39947 RepID=B9FJY8_ORYSJ|nr:hypothetical protein OsJ_18996 [Oryza sativa Japonica Group]
MQFHQGRHHRHPNVGVVLFSVFFWEKPTQHTIIGVGEGGQRPATTRWRIGIEMTNEYGLT